MGRQKHTSWPRLDQTLPPIQTVHQLQAPSWSRPVVMAPAPAMDEDGKQPRASHGNQAFTTDDDQSEIESKPLLATTAARLSGPDGQNPTPGCKPQAPALPSTSTCLRTQHFSVDHSLGPASSLQGRAPGQQTADAPICRFCLEEEAEDDEDDDGWDMEEGRLLPDSCHSSSMGHPGLSFAREHGWWHRLCDRIGHSASKSGRAGPHASTTPQGMPCTPAQHSSRAICKNPLIVPCLCTGTLRYVHQNCLQKWRDTDPQKAMFQCTVCGYAYRFKGARLASIMRNPATPGTLMFSLLIAMCCVLGFLPVLMPSEGQFAIHMLNGFVVLGILGLANTLSDLFSSRRMLFYISALRDGEELSSTATYTIIISCQILAMGVFVGLLLLSTLWQWGMVFLASLGYNQISCTPVFKLVQEGCNKLIAMMDMSTSNMLVDEIYVPARCIERFEQRFCCAAGPSHAGSTPVRHSQPLASTSGSCAGPDTTAAAAAASEVQLATPELTEVQPGTCRIHIRSAPQTPTKASCSSSSIPARYPSYQLQDPELGTCSEAADLEVGISSCGASAYVPVAQHTTAYVGVTKECDDDTTTSWGVRPCLPPVAPGADVPAEVLERWEQVSMLPPPATPASSAHHHTCPGSAPCTINQDEQA